MPGSPLKIVFTIIPFVIRTLLCYVIMSHDLESIVLDESSSSSSNDLFAYQREMRVYAHSSSSTPVSLPTPISAQQVGNDTIVLGEDTDKAVELEVIQLNDEAENSRDAATFVA